MTTPGDGAPVSHTCCFSWLGHSCFSQATRLASLGGEYLKGETEKAYRAEHESRVNEGSRLPTCFIPVLSRRPRVLRQRRPGRLGHQTLDPSTAPTGTRREELPALVLPRSACCHTGPNMRRSSEESKRGSTQGYIAKRMSTGLQKKNSAPNLGQESLDRRVERKNGAGRLQKKSSVPELEQEGADRRV